MPETKSNGYSNGNHIHNGYETEDNASFLFTSESVGEGHPGKPINLGIWTYFSSVKKILPEWREKKIKNQEICHKK